MFYRRSITKLFVFLSWLLFAHPVTAQESQWDQLNARVQEFLSQGKYPEATAAAEEALHVAETSFGADDLKTATSADTIAELYYAAGKYAEAEPLFKRSLATREKALGPDDLAVGMTLNNLGALYRAQQRYAEAEPLSRRGLAILEKTLGPNELRVAASLNNLAAVYRDQRRYSDAEPLFERCVAIRERALGSNHPVVAISLNDLAEDYRLQRKFAAAEPLFKQSLTILESALGPGHLEVAATLDKLAELYQDEAKYSDAEPVLRRSLAITEKAFGPEHQNMAPSLNRLAKLCQLAGKYSEAETLFERSLAIEEKALGAEHVGVGVALNSVASLYMDEGKFDKAEPLLKRGLVIYEKSYGPEHRYVAGPLFLLAALYRTQGRLADAELLFRRCLAILEKTTGPDDSDVAKTLINIGTLDLLRANFADAEPSFKRGVAIFEKALGPDHPDVAFALDSMSTMYMGEGKFTEAEPLLKRSLAIREKALGSDHRDVARSLNHLALLYYAQGRYSEAEPLFKRALTIIVSILGPDHQDVATALDNLALLYYSQGNYSEAEAFLDRGLHNISKQFETNFTYMSEKDRLQFLNTAPRLLFNLYFSFCTSNIEREPALASKMYDLLLWEKGLVSSSVVALRAQVSAGGNTEALTLFDRVTAKRSESSRLAATRPAGWQDSKNKVDDEANELEEQLARRVSAFAEQKSLSHVTWRDVRDKLQPGEAAVEFARFPYYDGKKWSDASRYVALIVSRQSKGGPTLVSLGHSDDLEADPLRDYRLHVGLRQNRTVRGVKIDAKQEDLGSPPKTTFYDAFWKPLEPALAGTTRIYISPDGALNQLSLGAVPAADGRLLMEKYDLRIVSSTKDVLLVPRRYASNTAILVGNPTFDLNETQQRAALRAFRSHESPQTVFLAQLVDSSPATALRSRDLAGGTLPALPGTQKEVEAIGALLEKHHWNVQTFTQANALKEAVDDVKAPRVLHLATHGFFEPDQKKSQPEPGAVESSALEDPMLRSGLYLAGANRGLSGKSTPSDLDDGVLTAYEASSLNLQGTELVVLSACETGLGEVAAGEGVFGLRRALQVAGAESVLLSMWSVPDKETQELMTLFYEKWLSGKDKHQALREGQLEMRSRVKSRYGKDLSQYWAAFVLVGR